MIKRQDLKQKIVHTFMLLGVLMVGLGVVGFVFLAWCCMWLFCLFCFFFVLGAGFYGGFFLVGAVRWVMWCAFKFCVVFCGFFVFFVFYGFLVFCVVSVFGGLCFLCVFWLFFCCICWCYFFCFCVGCGLVWDLACLVWSWFCGGFCFFGFLIFL